MEKKIMDRKEYLKRYISYGNDTDKKKKKVKKHKLGTKRVKIIDDDIETKNMRPLEEGEFDILLQGEDAPIIAGVIDERGPIDFLDKKRWRVITENEEGDLTITDRSNDMEKRDTQVRENINEQVNSSPPRHDRSKHSNFNSCKRSESGDSDLSPPRQHNNYDSDLSPPRRHKNSDADLSPPRRNIRHRTSNHAMSGRKYDNSGNRDSDLDFSSSKKGKQDSDMDLCKSRRNRKDSDSNFSVSRHRDRRVQRDRSLCTTSQRTSRLREYSDESSYRSSRHHVSRSKESKRERRREHIPENRIRRKRSRWDKETECSEYEQAEHSRDRDGRMTKTLDGKIAGLQNARALREETEAHKRREAEQFSKLSKEVSGVGRTAIVRDKTGRKRNLEMEAVQETEQKKQQREIDEKYAKWGRGLKQVADCEEKLKSDLYEMNKPLARYADDEDLDKQLRDQEREGDPMLKYIKEKHIKEGKREPDLPRYQGAYAPNRFGIKPGYRWDGVDRSNGYEKKWFQAQNAKVARREEAYKWSTADM